ncbi:MAG TPA: hypothetical protein VHA05_03025 [Candidatus Saccharimonadales bacterium]|nr:hypothetical protein [Candidatus Saccharimonadales bacterium]
MPSERSKAIDNLSAAADGSQVAHVWRSDRYPGADMVIRYRIPGVEVTPDEHGLPENFAADVGLTYAGSLSREEAAQKLQSMRAANAIVDVTAGQ